MIFLYQLLRKKKLKLLQGAVELVLRRLPELMKEEIEARSERSLGESSLVLLGCYRKPGCKSLLVD
jgi:hypothetical protein